jgi:hypothetical protein
MIAVKFEGNTYAVGVMFTTTVAVTGITTPEPGSGATQAITFSPQSSASFGTKIQLTARATSNLPVVISTTTPAICVVSQSADGSYSVTSAAGLAGDANTCILQASQAGDSRWSPAPILSRSIRWVRIAQTITFNTPSSRYYGGAPTVLTATASSGLPVTYTTNTPTVCRIDTVDSQSVVNYVLPLPSATYSYCYIYAAQAGDGTYSPAPSTTRGISLRKENTVTLGTWNGAVTAAGTTVDLVVKSSSQPTLNESLAGETPLVVTSATPNVCKVDSTRYFGSSTSHTQATVKALWNGTCQLSVSFAGNSYWIASTTYVSKSITGMTTPEPGANVRQSIGMSMQPTSEISAVTLINPTSGSKLPVAVRSLTPNVCSVTPAASGYSLTTVAGIVGNGNICTIEATQAGDDRWAAAAPVIRTITFNKAAMSVRLNRLATFLVGKSSELFVIENRYMNASMNKGLNSIGHISTAVSTTPAVCTVSNVGPLTTTVGVHTQFTVTAVANGACSITFGFAGSDTQSAAYRTHALTVTGIK